MAAGRLYDERQSRKSVYAVYERLGNRRMRGREKPSAAEKRAGPGFSYDIEYAPGLPHLGAIKGDTHSYPHHPISEHELTCMHASWACTTRFKNTHINTKRQYG